MLDDNVKKKFKIGIIFIVSILICIFYIKYNIKNEKNKLDINCDYEINNIIDQITSDQIEELSKKDLKEIQNKLKDISKSISDNKNDKIKVSFILGSIDILNNNNKDAIDKLSNAIKMIGRGTDPKLKVWINCKLAQAYTYNGNYEKAEIIFDNAIGICKREYTKEGLIDIYIYGRPLMLEMPNGVAKLAKLSDDALQVSKKINYKLTEVYSMAGVANSLLGNTIKGIEYKLKAIELSKKEGKKELEMQDSVEIAISYIDLENYKEAIKYLEDSLKCKTGNESEDAIFKSYALVNLVEAYVKVGDTKKAEKNILLLEQTIGKVASEDQREDTISVIYALKSQVELKNKNFTEAKKLLDESTKRYEKNLNKFNYVAYDIYLAEVYGDIYYESGNYLEALKYHKGAEKLAIKKGTDYYDAKHTKKIYLDYKGLNDYENAARYMDKYIKIESDINREHDIQYTEYLHKKFEGDEKQEKILRLEKNKRTLYLVIVGLVIISITIGVMGRHIHKKNKEINKLNKLFKNLSITDGLTGIPNRRALDEYFDGNWDLYKETQMPISIAMIDIDFFKQYNDNYGHPKGDKVLEIIAKCIKNSIRNSDFIARYGGEEFIIIMLKTDINESINIVEKLRKNINGLDIKHEYSEVSSRVTLSIGISTTNMGEINDYDEYIKKADEALYKAKNNGRNTYVHANKNL